MIISTKTKNPQESRDKGGQNNDEGSGKGFYYNDTGI